MNLRTISVIVLFLILAGGVGIYIWNDVKPDAIDLDLTGIGPEGTTTGGVAIKPIPINNPAPLPPPPSLDRPITFPDSIPTEAREPIRAKILALEASLKKDSSNYENWLNLGIQRKFIDDFVGAKESWEYAAILSPKGFVPFYNLGGLYGYYIHDNKKAEDNYLKASANGPDQIYIWRDIYSFYRDVLKDDAKAKKALVDGIARNPNTSKDLQYLLDNFNSL